MKWRKKPVIIDAEIYHLGMEDGFIVCVAGEEYPQEVAFKTYEEAQEFSKTGIYDHSSLHWQKDTCKRRRSEPIPYIYTLEGSHHISEGDYIITGEQSESERYPCKPDIFLKTYERITKE